jgi:phosphohistidine phosphatase SixA
MALHLVRHAKAGDPRGDDDESRPLSAAGRAQAKVLGKALGSLPVERVLTSRYVRCVETVEPAAARLGLTVEVHDALSEEASIKATWALLEELATGGTEAIVCSHGPVLSAVLDRVHRRGVDIEATEWSCRKASIWRLETDKQGAFRKAVLALKEA